MTTTVDISDYVAGDSLRIDFTVLQSDGAVFPDLATCTIEWHLDQVGPLGPGRNILTKSLGHGVALVSAAAGTVRVDIAPGEISAMGAMLHSLVVTTAGGQTYTVTRGEFLALSSI